jgi:hypothetical protein
LHGILLIVEMTCGLNRQRAKNLRAASKACSMLMWHEPFERNATAFRHEKLWSAWRCCYAESLKCMDDVKSRPSRSIQVPKTRTPLGCCGTSNAIAEHQDARLVIRRNPLPTTGSSSETKKRSSASFS